MPADSRKQADAKSRGGGVLALIGGVIITGLTWYWAISDGKYDVKVAVLGPLAFVLGIGLLVHGAEIPVDGITRRARQYGFFGSLAGLLNLFLLGYFHKPHSSRVSLLLHLAVPVVVIAVWFLPDRFFGGPGSVPPKPADAPIEP